MELDGNTNGSGESRLDRLERLLEQHVIENHDAHVSFMQEHKLLLTAQVVMTDKMSELETKMLETTDKLNALIDTVDGLIKRNGVQ
jgi:hypothetical protein